MGEHYHHEFKYTCLRLSPSGLPNSLQYLQTDNTQRIAENESALFSIAFAEGGGGLS